jgi:myosin heavy subunit
MLSNSCISLYLHSCFAWLKEVGSCSRLYQNTVDQVHIASDLSKDLKKLKQAYETLSSKKDKEVSALLSEKDSVHNQLSIMQQDYVALLKNKKVEAAHVTEAALKLQQSVDELKVLAQKKDDEIARLHSMVKEKDVEIQRLKGCHPESIQKHNKDISETHKSFRSDDPAVRSKSKINGLRKMVEDYISQTEMVRTDRQDGTHQKRRRASSRSNVSISSNYMAWLTLNLVSFVY